MPTPASGPSLDTPQLLEHVEQALPIQQIFPVQAVLLGGVVLLGIVLFHGAMMRLAQGRVANAGLRAPRLRLTLRIELVMVTVAFILLSASLAEVVIWAAALKYAGIFRTWVAAASYAATMYTTLGNVSVPPPPGWHMVGPIIAISGLFTFGWTGSVLVDVVARLGRLRDETRAARAARAGHPPPPAVPS